MKTYTAWGFSGHAHTLVEGPGPPRYIDGSLLEDCPERIWTIEAENWEDACAKYHELQGWESYVPMENEEPSDA